MDTRTYLNITKATDSKLIANNKLNGEKIKVILVKSETRQGCLLYSCLFTIEHEDLASSIRQQKQIMGIQIGKEEGKVSLFTDDVIVCTNDPQSSTRELPQSKNTFSKVDGYKIYSKNY